MHRCQMWDTSEAYNMLNAEEPIYLQAMQQPTPEALREFFEQTYPEGKIVHNAEPVAFDDVGWTFLYTWLHNEEPPAETPSADDWQSLREKMACPERERRVVEAVAPKPQPTIIGDAVSGAPPVTGERYGR